MYTMFCGGNSVADIARERDIQPGTVLVRA